MRTFVETMGNLPTGYLARARGKAWKSGRDERLGGSIFAEAIPNGIPSLTIPERLNRIGLAAECG
jgi:hypothetical protein